MAKFFMVMLGLLLVLNVMTFLVVVSPGTEPRKTGDNAAPDAGSRRSGPTEAQLQKIDKLETAINSLKASLTALSRDVKDMPRTIVAQLPRATAAAAEEHVPATSPSPPASTPTSSSRRKGPTDFSRVTPPPAQGGPAGRTEEAEENGTGSAGQPATNPARGAPPAEGTTPPPGEGEATTTPAGTEGEGAPATPPAATPPAEGEGAGTNPQ
jgi:hypothetical protein